MSGTLLAAAAGVGFGVFQTLNRRAVGGMSDAYLATFLQLLVALVVLAIATLATTDLELLAEATAAGIVFFALAGLVHFFVGWTLLNMSQMRIGAARTSPLLSTNPVFGVVVAAVTIQDVPHTLGWLGIGLIMAGAFVVARERVAETGWGVGWTSSVFGLGTALAWAISPVLIKEGLDGLSSPLLGLTLGMAAAVLAYAVLVALRGRPQVGAIGSRTALGFKLAAGIMVGLSVWARWVSLDTTGVAVVLALGLLSVPVVLAFSPLLMGRHVEQVTAQLWLGGSLVVAGGLVLIAS
ncbi:MAG TPA: EamA family transporter [Gaiellaceae bacterium]|nr:EamA family transporter [Gaiellaceae bacterium]